MSAAGPRRLSAWVVALCVAALAGACGGGSGVSPAEQAEATESACALVARLQEGAKTLASVDVADPDAFRRDLDAAVLDYVNTLDSLAEVVPTTLRRDVAAVQENVQAYRFEEALSARASLDDWAKRSCS